MNRLILFLLLLPAMAFSQGPYVPDQVFNEETQLEDSPSFYTGYPPQILPITAIRADCPSARDVEFLYSRECRPRSIRLYNGNTYDVPLENIVCRTTDDGLGFPSGSVCQVTLTSSFLDEVLERTRGVPSLSYTYNSRSTSYPYFTISIDFGPCGTAERTIRVINPTADGAPTILNDWTDNSVIQAGVPVEGAILGSILSGCFAYCEDEPKTCSAVPVTLLEATAIGWGVNGEVQVIQDLLSLGGEVTYQTQSGAEITAEIPAATISAGPGELCVPLFSIISDYISVENYQYNPGSCEPVLLGNRTTIRPRGGVNTVTYEGEKFCYDVDCPDIPESNRPTIETIPGTIQDNGGTIFNIRFDLDDPFLRGSIEIEWEGITPEDPFFIEDVAPGTYCYSLTTKCCAIPIEGCLDVCPNPTEGEWQINEADGSACRQIICPSESPLQGNDPKSGSTDNTYEECVPLTFDAYEFDEFTRTCRRAVRIAATGELLTYQNKPATFVDTYDEALGVCVREYYCDENSTAVEEESQLPNYGNWQFDLFDRVCFREIVCFGQTLSDQKDTKEPTYDWSFDDFTDNCRGVVLCDGSPVFGVLPVMQLPISYGFWEYNSFEQLCVRTANCELGLDGQVTQREEPEYEYSYDAFSGWCKRTPICDGSFVFGSEETIFPHEVEDWNINIEGPTCSRTVKCEYTTGTWIEQSVIGTFAIGIPRPECAGNNTFYVVCNGEVTDEWFCGTNLDGGGKPTSNASTDADIEIVQDVYPNPFRNELTFTLQASKSTTAQLILSNLTGVQVIEEVVDLVGGENRIHFNTSKVVPGTYTLRVIHNKTGELITAKQVVKQ